MQDSDVHHWRSVIFCSEQSDCNGTHICTL